MKKLLLSLSALSISTGSVFSVISCGNDNFQKQQKYISIDNLDIILNQVSKAVYLNETKDYDSNYLMNTYVQPKQIKDITDKPLDINDEFTRNFYFNEMFNKYFKTDYLPEAYLDGIKPQSKGLLDVIANLFKLMFGFIDNDGLKTLYDLFNKLGLSKMLPEELLTFANGLLSKEDIAAFANAFDDSIYEGLTYQETLDSSIIGLVNAFNKLTQNEEMFDYSSKENVEKNITPALESLQSNFKDIKNLKLDILEDMGVFAEILRFARTMIIYVNQFDYTQELKWDQIQTIRNKTFAATEVDLKKFLSQVNTAMSDETGETTRRVVASMFQTHEESRIWNKNPLFPSTIKSLADNTIYNEGFGGLFKSIINGLIEPINLIGLNINVGSAIMDFIDLSNSNIKIGTLWKTLLSTIASSMPEKLGKTIQSEEFMNDFFASIYNGQVFKDNMGFNLNSLFDKKTIGYKETKLSIREMIKEMNDSLVNSTLAIDNQTLANIFEALNFEIEYNGVTSTVFDHATKNKDNFLEILNTKVIDNQSTLNFVDKTLKDLAGFKDIFSFTQIWEAELEKDIEDSKKAFEIDFNSLNSTQIKVEDYNFEYQINDSKILMNLILKNDYFEIKNIQISNL
ncbi:hypothetical protein [Spiroplasma culicicola]|uniref:MOLPALP family lipoprotein n=1 Tax=Spiroplasma culicicola AES-1 TaxID=1276246 RepID=W6AGK2_9MOLU|nr:hypothetical protein [Spiroplasma culicicola]AHI52809.1 hypothetical protein SCULI_v1c04680 [Spiroplasma culicicola AES-1]